jgi:Protein of unknown function (DUF1475)
MTTQTAARILFGTILAGMLAVTAWAALNQNVWEWRGLVTEPDRGWTIATLCDAYAGFLTFYAWVFCKERTAARVLWFVAIVLLGNIAMSVYVLRELARLGPDEPIEALLTRRAVAPR